MFIALVTGGNMWQYDTMCGNSGLRCGSTGAICMTMFIALVTGGNMWQYDIMCGNSGLRCGNTGIC